MLLAWWYLIPFGALGRFLLVVAAVLGVIVYAGGGL